MKLRFEINGTAQPDGQTWATSGEVEIRNAGAFAVALDEAMNATFEQLTHGDAVFGKPGVGCRGPYTIRRFLIEAVDEGIRDERSR